MSSLRLEYPILDRNAVLARVRRNPRFDALVVGAGSSGAGTFRDLALNGIRTLLIDRADICSGASAASSRRLEGGLRTLENGELRTANEALHERDILLRNAPHYARPLPTAIPAFSWLSGWRNAPLGMFSRAEVAAERGALILKLGLMVHDSAIGRDSPLRGHSFRMRARSLARFPGLNPAIIGTASYRDGELIPLERLCAELVLDGEAEGSWARALTYVSLVGAKGDAVILRDELTGQTFRVRPRVVVNAAGPWIDLTNQTLGQATRLAGRTKSVQLVVDHPALRQAIGEHGFLFEVADGGTVEINPLGERLLIGWTDMPGDGPDQDLCSQDEQAALLTMVGKVFPGAALTAEQVVYRHAGVRPLPAEHHIDVIEPGKALSFPILSLVGGTWTTYRAAAEQAADLVMARLGAPRHYDTVDLGIGGGADYPAGPAERARWMAAVERRTGIGRERLEALYARYGTRAHDFAQDICASTIRDKPLRHAHDYTQGEIAYLVRAEHVVHLEDLALRRTSLALMGRMTRPLLRELAGIAGRTLGWTPAQVRAEVKATGERLAEVHGVRLDGSEG